MSDHLSLTARDVMTQQQRGGFLQLGDESRIAMKNRTMVSSTFVLSDRTTNVILGGGGNENVCENDAESMSEAYTKKIMHTITFPSKFLHGRI